MPLGRALYEAQTGDESPTPLSRQYILTSSAETGCWGLSLRRINKVHKLVDICKQMSSKHLSAMEMEG